MAVMRLLPEAWGRVTPAGIRLPLSLPTRCLGGLVGARRPTVTLAWGQARRAGLAAQARGRMADRRAGCTPVSTEAKAPQPAADGPTGFWAAHDPVEQAQSSLRALIQRVAEAHQKSGQGIRRARELTDARGNRCLIELGHESQRTGSRSQVRSTHVRPRRRTHRPVRTTAAAAVRSGYRVNRRRASEPAAPPHEHDWLLYEPAGQPHEPTRPCGARPRRPCFVQPAAAARHAFPRASRSAQAPRPIAHRFPPNARAAPVHLRWLVPRRRSDSSPQWPGLLTSNRPDDRE